MGLTNYGDVHLFHRKMGLLHPKTSQLLEYDLWSQRLDFMQEELAELDIAYAEQDLAKVFDGLLDLVYVVMGTGVMMGLPWQAGWDAVQYANMRKERDPSQDTEHHKGVIKPPGWAPPDLKTVLDRYVKVTKIAELYGAGPDQMRSDTYKPTQGDHVVADEPCSVCGERYDEHDGTEEHRFR